MKTNFFALLVASICLLSCQNAPVSTAPTSKSPEPIRRLAQADATDRNFNVITFNDLQDGDVIFQRSQSKQAPAIAEATGSEWTHVGLIFGSEENGWVVYQSGAKTPTPLTSFLKQGIGGHVVRRLAEGVAKESLTQKNLEVLKQAAHNLAQKPYDILFQWSDSQIYCSELVYKAYLAATELKIGNLQTWGDLKRDGPELAALVLARLRKLPSEFNVKELKEDIITPQAQFDSDLLVDVGILAND